MKRSLIYSLIIVALICFLASLPIAWNDYLTNTTSAFLFNLRGSRHLSDKLLICYIGDEEINNLGGWPIFRDYYSYFIHKISGTNIRAIGVDILFDRIDPRYPEFDSTMSSVIESSGRVVLPMVFEDIKKDTPPEKSLSRISPPQGIHPKFPIEPFRMGSAAIGFSNFGDYKNLIKIPFLVETEDDTVLSFGAEIARVYLGWSDHYQLKGTHVSFTDTTGRNHRISLDRDGYCRLNHFGDINDFNALSFLELLKMNEGEELNTLCDNRIIILTVTATGIASVKTSPFSHTLPASLIHATLTENIIDKSLIRTTPLIGELTLIILMALVALLMWRLEHHRLVIAFNIIIFFSFFIMVLLFLKFLYTLVPVFYPIISFVFTSIVLATEKHKRLYIQEQSIMSMLRDQIDYKEQQVVDVKEKLKELRIQLKDESRISQNINHLAEQREKTIQQLEKELFDLKTYSYKEKVFTNANYKDIIYSKNSKMAQVLELIAKVSSDDIPVLIIGETGTGKEIIARAIHFSSRRQKAPFIAVNCGALSETLLDSELFGHEKGSFTGAVSRRRGRFELANGGTILLDEITETTPAFQARLLRILQESTFVRVGGEQTIKIDVRIIAATNKALNDEMVKMRFRTDLYYRLNGFPITIPPLRERVEDIPLLALHFLKKYNKDNTLAFSGRAMELLQGYQWPGNVRELENIVRRAAILARSDGREIIKETDLPDDIISLKSELMYKPLERQILDSLQALNFSHSSISQTAKLLGDKDRGTITEYFKGICFEAFVQCNFDIERAAHNIANSTDKEIIARVTKKVTSYIDNVKSSPELNKFMDTKSIESIPAFKGLPKNYHIYLIKIIDYLIQNDQID
ncbi:sigma 54-interacting transcriptional regulator [candidate division KSB1 bacterium]|nr:sigma 54-interacting transcriptional regulator [candidate division KSB1 bacterium]